MYLCTIKIIRQCLNLCSCRMKQPDESWILRYIYRHERLAAIYEWLGEYWLMMVAYVLFVLFVLFIIHLAVTLVTTPHNGIFE